MAKFNSKTVSKPDTTTYEGGAAYIKKPIDEWVNMLFSSYLEPAYYESAETQQDRFIELTKNIIAAYGAEFTANAACFARDELGMRSISQLTAALLNNYKFDDKRTFFRKFCQRPDDMAEIFAAIDMLGNNRSHAIVRGFADYLTSLKPYQVAKYKMQNHEYNMADLINICHPKPSKAIQDFKDGILKPADTWETRISVAGSNKEEKAKNWIELVEEQKLGYIALIRNLRNILDAAPSRQWIVEELCPQITNKISIERSRIFPYQIYTAWRMLQNNTSVLTAALEDAFLTACSNMPEMPGSTAILLDVSGSMTDRISRNSIITIKEAGAVFAAMYALTNSDNIDCIKFATDAKRFNLQGKKYYSPFELINELAAGDCGGSTNVSKAFALLNQKYNRILLISDMQCMDPADYRWGWIDARADLYYADYCGKFGSGTHIYSFDLGNYHNQIDNPNNPYVHLATALNEKIFEIMKYIEDGSNLVDYINSHYNYRK